jgi:2-oxo-4-hydroxy-4-carboxy-5-ureidoimidazoline decarboxylase
MEPWRRLDLATTDGARELLGRCCGSSRWVERMLGRRPFTDRATLLAAARDEWFGLSEPDWHEAFSHHPQIGDREGLQRRSADTRPLSASEQQGVNAASDEVLAALAAGNRLYEKKFGYIFIVCATGKGTGQMLELLEERLQNDPDTEIRLAAGEQSKITEIRLLGL